MTDKDNIGDIQWLRPASSGREDIFSRLWLPDCMAVTANEPDTAAVDAASGSEPGAAALKPRAVIQIAHGMAEHSARYDEFARFLTGNGFIVCMNDHAGHGPHAGTLGYFADADGPDHVTEDIHSLFDAVCSGDSMFPPVSHSLPKFLLGHSMGSFISRKYLTRYGDELAGCILSGTMGINPALAFGKALARLQVKVKGPKSAGRLLTVIAFGSYNKRIKNPVNRNAWLSTADDVCEVYEDDPYCGFPFTALGFVDLFTIMQEISAPGWAASVPKELPVYIFSGGEDPVGAYGKGPAEVYDRLQKTGHRDLTLKIYPAGRHEMLNETNNAEVYDDVLTWVNDRLG
ncbi:MAG: lysophospholipase [Clostridiales Family XIII bacterium]|nr:lysophospholipase [Clostridiales Family XIII bacterium]